jgi:hypothetical protein
MISKIRNYLLSSEETKSNIFIIVATFLVGPSIFYMFDNQRKKAKYVGMVAGKDIPKNLYMMKSQEIADYFNMLSQFFDKKSIELFIKNQFGSMSPEEVVFNQFESRYVFDYYANLIGISTINADYIKHKSAQKDFSQNYLLDIIPHSVFNENGIDEKKINQLFSVYGIQGNELENEIVYIFKKLLVTQLLNLVSGYKIQKIDDYSKNITLNSITIDLNSIEKNIVREDIADKEIENFFLIKNYENKLFYSPEKRLFDGFEIAYKNEQEKSRIISDVKTAMNEDNKSQKLHELSGRHISKKINFEISENNTSLKQDILHKLFSFNHVGSALFYDDSKDQKSGKIVVVTLKSINEKAEVPFSEVKEVVWNYFKKDLAVKIALDRVHEERLFFEKKLKFTAPSKIINSVDEINNILNNTKPDFITRKGISWFVQGKEKNEIFIYGVKSINIDKIDSHIGNKIKEHSQENFSAYLQGSLIEKLSNKKLY